MKGDKAFACLGSALVLESGHPPGGSQERSRLAGNEDRLLSKDIKGLSTAHPFHFLL